MLEGVPGETDNENMELKGAYPPAHRDMADVLISILHGLDGFGTSSEARLPGLIKYRRNTEGTLGDRHTIPGLKVE